MLPPFMNASGLVTKILTKITEASQPERFTQDFLQTRIGYGSGSARPIIPLLKRLGFIGSDGAPTALYSRFRSPDPEVRGAAMAEALRAGYKDVYERNEYAHDLPKEKFKALIVEMSGLKPDDRIVNAIVATFFNLKAFADFEAKPSKGGGERGDERRVVKIAQEDTSSTSQPPFTPAPDRENVGFAISYTINLNLPETADVEVFNAIFRALKEHLLKR